MTQWTLVHREGRRHALIVPHLRGLPHLRVLGSGALLVLFTACTGTLGTPDYDGPMPRAGVGGTTSGRIVSEVLLTIANIFGANLTALGKGASQARAEIPNLRIV